ncbi:hypothetical protein HELRODRAFT_170200 [Helobdella robusta]|uniref:Uncharacterized protein n=1 Tax=Helobdella robusta TaxID=6412 RepID=T1F2S1_HELRO|nr:hypothetical protein HELRODRAFT_170200 [Helobdella robusta]ESO07670.1 hypothetical protein HELRODRAFT_170200 [Helobdella robusta]
MTSQEESQMVSDGIVKWRRKLPEVDSAVANEKFERLMERNRNWVEQRKISFQQNENHRYFQVHLDEKRNIFGQQKSFSYESEHYPKMRQINIRPTEAQAASHKKPTLVDRRVMLIENKRKSYSLDENVPANCTTQTNNLCESRSRGRDEPNRPINTAYNPPSARDTPIQSRYNYSQEVNIDRRYSEAIKNIEPPLYAKSPTQNVIQRSTAAEKQRHSMVKPQNKRLVMLHDMKALNDNDDNLNGNQFKSEIIKTREELIAEKNKMLKKRISCRLPLSKLLSKFRMERVKK